MDKAKNTMNQYGKEGTPFLFVIDFKMKAPLVYKLDALPTAILYDVNGVKNYEPIEIAQQEFYLNKFPKSIDKYTIAYEKVLENLRYGNSYLVNLTQPTKIETNLSLKDIFYRSSAKYKLYYQDNFVVFSPEIFIKITNGIITSYPMKGTIDAAIKDAEKIILHDAKETAEHYTIVDLIRNDLSMVAKNVKVDRFRYIDHLKTSEKHLLQVSSQISGKLPSDYQHTIGDIICKLLPAGSISGAPKKKTIEIIDEVEGYDRGYYTGIFGIFDGKNLDSGVMIRFIEKDGADMYYKSGGGITINSVAENEYNELIDKVYVPFA